MFLLSQIAIGSINLSMLENGARTVVHPSHQLLQFGATDIGYEVVSGSNGAMWLLCAGKVGYLSIMFNIPIIEFILKNVASSTLLSCTFAYFSHYSRVKIFMRSCACFEILQHIRERK